MMMAPPYEIPRRFFIVRIDGPGIGVDTEVDTLADARLVLAETLRHLRSLPGVSVLKGSEPFLPYRYASVEHDTAEVMLISLEVSNPDTFKEPTP